MCTFLIWGLVAFVLPLKYFKDILIRKSEYLVRNRDEWLHNIYSVNHIRIVYALVKRSSRQKMVSDIKDLSSKVELSKTTSFKKLLPLSVLNGLSLGTIYVIQVIPLKKKQLVAKQKFWRSNHGYCNWKFYLFAQSTYLYRI